MKVVFLSFKRAFLNLFVGAIQHTVMTCLNNNHIIVHMIGCYLSSCQYYEASKHTQTEIYELPGKINQGKKVKRVALA